MATSDARGLLAILDSAELMVAGGRKWLSAEEFDQYSDLALVRRREEWLAGRVAAKFVFLERERSASARSEGLRLQKIDAGTLAQFPVQAYRDVIVSRDKSPSGGPARIGRRSGDESITTAISHVDGLACAFIGEGGVYSVDLETPSARNPAFYLHNFTARERDWTGSCSRLFNLKSDWLYTLLWSAKECLLKTPPYAGVSLWNMSSVEIDILAGCERLKTVHEATSLSGNLEFLRAQTLQGCGPRRQFQVAVGGTANLILAAITILD